MTEHVDEVVNNNIEIVAKKVVNVIQQVLSIVMMNHLRVRKTDVFFQAFQLATKKFFFEEVLATFFIVVLPFGRKLFFNFGRHEAGENRITAVLGCCRKDAVKSILL